jgi:hypothetical protein
MRAGLLVSGRAESLCEWTPRLSACATWSSDSLDGRTFAGPRAETFNALLLSKSLRQRLWTDSKVETRQVPGIGPLIAQRLAAAGVHSLRQLAAVEPRRLESMAQRHFPFGAELQRLVFALNSALWWRCHSCQHPATRAPAAGNEVHAALAACLPPEVSLQCLPVAWLPGGLLELEVKVERQGGTSAPSPARLLVGSLHDNALLLCRPLALEQFPSPLVLRTRTRGPAGGAGAPLQVSCTCVQAMNRLCAAIEPTRCETILTRVVLCSHKCAFFLPAQVVASIVHEKLVGVDVAVRTVVPPGAKLQGRQRQAATQACAAAPEPAAADGLMERGQEGPVQPAEPCDGPTAAVQGARKPRKSGRAAEKPGRALVPAKGAKHGHSQMPIGPAAPAVAAPPKTLTVQAETLGPPLQPASVTAPAAVTDSAGKWRQFVAPAPEGQAQGGGTLQQLSLQETLQRSAAKAKGRPAAQPGGLLLQSQGAGLGPPSAAAPGTGDEPPAAPSAAALSASPGGMPVPGGLFAQFAFRGAAEARPAAMAGPTAALRRAPTATAHPQPRGLLGSLPAERAATAAGGQAASALQLAGHKRKLDAATPARDAAATSAAAGPAAAPAIPATKLNLPKLSWLSVKFSQPAASTPAAAPTTQAADVPTGAPAAATDFSRMFGFL